MTLQQISLTALAALMLLTSACSVTSPATGQPSASPSARTDSPTISSHLNHKQGPLKASTKASDWAIDGPGYFTVFDSQHNKTYYTRNGAFQFNANGQVVNANGYLLQPAITIEHPADFSHISEGGTVWVKQEENFVQIGRITTVLFPKPEGLKALGGRDGLFEATDAAGKPDTHQPKQNGAGFIIGSALEDFSTAAISVPDRGCRQSQTQPSITQVKTDWAIEGAGYFTFLDPATGELYYTRRASIKLDLGGQLVSDHGYPLNPAITIPPNQELERIDADGSVWSTGEKAGQPKKLGYLTVSLIAQPQALMPLGFSRGSIYLAPAAAGKISDFQPGSGGAGTIKSGALENCGQELNTLPVGFLGQNRPLGIIG